jgi:hypothetical protein
MKSRIARQKSRPTDGLNAPVHRGSLEGPAPKPSKRFSVDPHSLGLKSGIDVRRFNQLLDELDIQAFAAKRRASKKKRR